MKIDIKRCKIIADARGISYDALLSPEIKWQVKAISIRTSKPGTLRGNHYHKKKREWLGVISGEAKFVLLENKTGKKKVIKVSGSNPMMLDIPVNVTHTIVNTGKRDMVILEMSSRVYKKSDPDTFRNEIV